MKKLIFLFLFLFFGCQKEYRLDIRDVQREVDTFVYCYFFGNYMKDVKFYPPHIFKSHGHLDYINNRVYMDSPTNYAIACSITHSNYVPSGIVKTNELLQLLNYYETNKVWDGKHYQKHAIRLILDMLKNPEKYNIKRYEW